MFEMMLSTVSKKRIEVPNSGLGSRYLIAGDEVGGYFGIVKGSESFTPTAVATLGPIPGTVNTAIGDDVWCKFIYRGTTLLIARQPFIAEILFNTVYNAGLAFGVDGPGLTPSGATAINQNKIISRVGTDGKTYRYRVRLIRGFTVDPTNTTETAIDSEYRLFENIIPTGGNPITWATTVTSVAGYSNGIWLKESQIGSTYRWTAGGNSSFLTRASAQPTSTRNWRPCLELIVE